ncbi:AcrB/AcrD/AcrF family protein [Halopseudomonas laoshanensis]|uniref:AcrB/AcrD/AcrF family protein n=1 Tax=Halopseudomonas laoshanensis TaxID=2268758 RepID=A0A7V7GWK7_9GAMM|nr:efflux RND transporter permease subunit [Halopseudomonas laoshanensis]KAA0696714.1 AcrB/AcrD/AcrF family protein [Halopseudomonas laoshanensis]
MSHDPLRFNLSAHAVREKSVTLFFLLIVALAGIYSFFALGRAEDPQFSVRAMVVSVNWPGASAEQMQQQVADPLEKRIMEVAYFDKIETTARPGLVTMQVTFEDFTPSGELPQLFYEVRKRMQDEAPRLPPGVQGPFVNDDFSDVYFSLYSLTAPGMPQRQLVREAEALRNSFNRVEGVQKVRIIGEQSERVFVDLDAYRMAQLGLSLEQIADALEAYNRLLPAGLIETQGSRLYWRIDADLADLDAIRDVPLRVDDRLIRLGDVAEVVRGYEDPPSYMVRAFGEDALLLGVVLRKGENGLDVGEHLSDTYHQLADSMPLGMELRQVTNQREAITRAVELFQIKFLIAVLVVMLVSFVSLGLRPGLIVGIAVPLTLGITFLLMLMRGMNLDRITLGALIIALGLLVDDAIIAIEMMLVKMEEGWDKVRAAAHAWTVTAAPMLSGTLVTVIGFVPIGFAKSGVGEYTGNIFWVLAFALLASWFVAVVFTPWLGVALLKEVKSPHTDHAQTYNTRGYQRFRRLIASCVRYRKSVVLATVGLFALAIVGMGAVVQKQFFPSSDRPEVLIEVFMPEGSSISATDDVARRLEAALKGHEEVVSLSTYVGAGAPRFFLSLNPEQPNPGFAKLVAIARDDAGRDQLIRIMRERVAAGEFPEARVRVHQLVFGPPVVWPVSFRVMGPDTDVLRGLADQVRQIMAEHPAVFNANLDWSERVPVARLKLDNERLRSIGLTPRELSRQLQFQWGGMPATVLREDVRSVQLVMRGVPEGIKDFADLPLRTADGRNITLQQAGLIEMVSEDPVLKRYNREPFITVQGDVRGAQPPDVTWALWEQLDELRQQLPAGYHLEVGGSVEQSAKGQASIKKVQPIMIGLMMIIIMLQMRSFSGTFMVLATAPLGVIGATLALIIGNQPFGFVALLGLTGLAGILMRNTLILTMQIDDNLASGMNKFDALVEATVQRTRPVLLTALAAALAFVPLAHDAFWGPMAYVLIGGTLVGTLITLLFLPALYALWFRVKPAGQ